MPRSTEQNASELNENLTTRDLTEILVRHFGFKEGIFALSIEFQFGVGELNAADKDTLTGAIFALKSFGLKRVDKETKNTVNAAKLSQRPKKSSK